MKIAQVVALMAGVAYSLTSATIAFVNMVTTSNESAYPSFGPTPSSTTPICYWVAGLLFFCLAGSLNRVHKPIATAIGIPGILLMLTGGIGSFIFMFNSQMLPIVLNFVSSLLFLTAIFLIYKFDNMGNVTPVYQTNPRPTKPAPMAVPQPIQQPYATPQQVTPQQPTPNQPRPRQ